MRRALSALRYDLVLEYRYRFYHVYAVVTALYGLALHFIPRSAADLLLPLLIFSDPAVLGFYVVAAMVLYERDARTLEGIRVTPLRPGEYLAARATSLAVLSILSSLALAVLARGLAFNVPLLLLGAGLTGSAYVLIGFILVARHDNFSSFLLDSVLAMAVLGLPAAGYLGIFRTPLYYALPGQPALALIGGAFSDRPGGALIACSPLLLVAWNGVLFLWARNEYTTRIVRGGRGARR